MTLRAGIRPSQRSASSRGSAPHQDPSEASHSSVSRSRGRWNIRLVMGKVPKARATALGPADRSWLSLRPPCIVHTLSMALSDALAILLDPDGSCIDVFHSGSFRSRYKHRPGIRPSRPLTHSQPSGSALKFIFPSTSL